MDGSIPGRRVWDVGRGKGRVLAGPIKCTRLDPRSKLHCIARLLSKHALPLLLAFWLSSTVHIDDKFFFFFFFKITKR